MSKIKSYTEREKCFCAVALAYLLVGYVAEVGVDDFTAVNIIRIALDGKAHSKVYTHLAAPVEPVAYARRKVHTPALRKIVAETDVAERCKTAEFKVGAALHEHRHEPTVDFAAAFQADTGAGKENGVYLIAV